jgi:opacity protein-like surface antigen
MKTILLISAMIIATLVSAQETVKIYEVPDGIQPPIGEWYVVEGEDYDGVFYMDFESEEDMMIQLELSLSELGTAYEFRNLVDMGDGVFYYEWEGVNYDENGEEVAAHMAYMFIEEDDTFHRLSLQYFEK